MTMLKIEKMIEILWNNKGGNPPFKKMVQWLDVHYPGQFKYQFTQKNLKQIIVFNFDDDNIELSFRMMFSQELEDYRPSV